jgi:hypothetical protein
MYLSLDKTFVLFWLMSSRTFIFLPVSVRTFTFLARHHTTNILLCVQKKNYSGGLLIFVLDGLVCLGLLGAIFGQLRRKNNLAVGATEDVNDLLGLVS